MEHSKRTNYIFVDFENTQVVDLMLIQDKPVVVVLLLGEKQKHLPVTLVQQALEFPEKVRLEISVSGKNALDFILAYHLGQCVQQDPAGYFHIVSKDKGFDPLIAHLKQQKISAARHDEFSSIPLLVNHQQTTLNDKILFVLERLSKPGVGRPGKREKLIAYINAVFARQLPENEVLGLVRDMEQRKIIAINGDDKVTYSL